MKDLILSLAVAGALMGGTIWLLEGLIADHVPPRLQTPAAAVVVTATVVGLICVAWRLAGW